MVRRSFLVDWNTCLGGGGEGEVFLGRAIDSGELCAIKVSVSLDRRAARSQLARELSRCRRVDGGPVVGLIAWNLEAPRPFIAFELAHAGSLADEMRALREQGQVYHPVQALERAREVLKTLAHVHARGMIHRDVKPANLLRFGHELRLADFGTALPEVKLGTLEAKEVVGTRMYAAPEQLAAGDIDVRADLYSVGVMLHEMLTGRAPRRAGEAGPYPSALVLPDLHHLLERLLAPEPARRPLDCTSALTHVDRVLRRYRAVRRLWSRLHLGASPY